MSAGNDRLYSKLRLSREFFHALYKLLLGSGYYDFINFVWHGGEPTLVGAEFLDEIMTLQHEYLRSHQKVENSIQTNATVITPTITDVLVKHNVNVGVSLDAPPEVNNKLRIFWDGKPTLSRVLEGVELMRRKGLNPGAICVLTQTNYLKAREIYEFFKSLGMSYQFNPMYADEGVCEGVAHSLAVNNEQYAQALLETYDLYVQDPQPTITVTDIGLVISSLMTGCSQNCLYAGKCEEFIGVLPNGEVYLCDLFYKPEQRIGKLGELTLQQLTNSPVLIKIGQRSAALQATECHGCEWWGVCKGGCSSKARAIFGDAMRKDPFCETRKILFSHIRDTLVQKGGETSDATNAASARAVD